MRLENKNRIKLIREHFNLTVAELSEMLSIPARTIGSWERGENPPNEKFMTALIERLNVNINWFLTGKGDMIISPSYGSTEDETGDLTKEDYKIISEIMSTDTGKNVLLSLISIKKERNRALDSVIFELSSIRSAL